MSKAEISKHFLSVLIYFLSVNAIKTPPISLKNMEDIRSEIREVSEDIKTLEKILEKNFEDWIQSEKNLYRSHEYLLKQKELLQEYLLKQKELLQEIVVKREKAAAERERAAEKAAAERERVAAEIDLLQRKYVVELAIEEAKQKTLSMVSSNQVDLR